MNRRIFLKRIATSLVVLPFTGRFVYATASPANDVKILEVPLAGFQFHQGESVWRNIHQGDLLSLAREPGNIHDPAAVAVYWKGNKLGFVPKSDNTGISQMLDRGKKLSARIAAKNDTENPWEKIMISIFLKPNT